jgi:hypothetical protein
MAADGVWSNLTQTCFVHAQLQTCLYVILIVLAQKKKIHSPLEPAAAAFRVTLMRCMAVARVKWGGGGGAKASWAVIALGLSSAKHKEMAT